VASFILSVISIAERLLETYQPGAAIAIEV